MIQTLVIFDLEFTAWPNSMAGHWLTPGQFKEVVQFGALRLELENLAVTATFDCLVKPRINPVLSEYFERLTGITNVRLAKEGVDFETAIGASSPLPAAIRSQHSAMTNGCWKAISGFMA